MNGDFEIAKWNMIDINYLPPIGKKVLWEFENGHIVHAAIGNDMIDFLRGNDHTGCVVRWMYVPL